MTSDVIQLPLKIQMLMGMLMGHGDAHGEDSFYFFFFFLVCWLVLSWPVLPRVALLGRSIGRSFGRTFGRKDSRIVASTPGVPFERPTPSCMRDTLRSHQLTPPPNLQPPPLRPTQVAPPAVVVASPSTPAAVTPAASLAPEASAAPPTAPAAALPDAPTPALPASPLPAVPAAAPVPAAPTTYASMAKSWATVAAVGGDVSAAPGLSGGGVGAPATSGIPGVGVVSGNNGVVAAAAPVSNGGWGVPDAAVVAPGVGGGVGVGGTAAVAPVGGAGVVVEQPLLSQAGSGGGQGSSRPPSASGKVGVFLFLWLGCLLCLLALAFFRVLACYYSLLDDYQLLIGCRCVSAWLFFLSYTEMSFRPGSLSRLRLSVSSPFVCSTVRMVQGLWCCTGKEGGVSRPIWARGC